MRGSGALRDVASQAKGIGRTGGYDPWSNVALVAGVDLSEWFDRAGTSVPGAFEQRLQQVEKRAGQEQEGQP